MQQAGPGCLSSCLPSARPAPTPRQERRNVTREGKTGLRSQHCSLRPLPSEAETQPPPPQILSCRVSALQASQRRSPTLTTSSPGQEEGWERGRGAPQGLLLPTFTPSFSKTSVLLAWSPGWVRCEGCPGEGWVCKCAHPKGEREADTLGPNSGLRGARRDANSEGQVNSWREHVETEVASGTSETRAKGQ